MKPLVLSCMYCKTADIAGLRIFYREAGDPVETDIRSLSAPARIRILEVWSRSKVALTSLAHDRGNLRQETRLPRGQGDSLDREAR
jgi:hypothetical protein